MRLSHKTIENLKLRDHRVELPDAGCAGLYLILQSSGARSWAIRYRFGGKPVKLTLGKWPAMSLADARKAAADAQLARTKGIDPAAAKQAAKVEAMEAQANTVASICAAYMKREGGKLRTAAARESILRRLVYPHIGSRPITEVKRSEIARLLDQIEDKSGTRMADVTLGVLRKIMTWYATRTDDFVPPFVRGMARQKTSEHRRERILDDTELRKLWAATADGGVFSALVRFLLLTSARRTEASALKLKEVDADGIWTLPASRSKTGVEVVRPLSKAAQAILAALPRTGDYPFTLNGGITPFKNFSDGKRALDVAAGVTGWRLHDLRRSSRSLMGRAGVSPDIAERCLGHAMPAMRATYDRNPYVPEMTHAFEMLAALVETITNPPEGAVIPMKRRR